MKKLKAQSILYLVAALLFCCCTDSKDSSEEYDSNQKIKLLTFEPDTGRIASQVLLNGENFGNDPSKLKVYFNNKEAAVVGVNNGTAYVLTPRLPGDTCKISVVIGKDSVSYEQDFYYATSYNVSTIVGKDTDKTVSQVGEFADVEFTIEVSFVHANYDNLYFLSTRHTGNELSQSTIMQVDTEAKVVRDLWPSSVKRSANRVMDTDPRTNITYSPQRIENGVFEMDPENLYAVKKRVINRPSAAQIENEGYVDFGTIAEKHSVGFCRYDNYFYTRARNGDIIKWDPLGNNVGTLVISGSNAGMAGAGDSFILFSPIPEESHIMYFSIPDRHAIYTWDASRPNEPVQLLCGAGAGTGGHQDGTFTEAEFKRPNQISFDLDGEKIYVADTGNHCIREIDLKNKLVTTIAGQPGEAGLQDGALEEAKFREPYGVIMDREGYIIIMDSGNRRLRKLAIE